MSKKRNIISIGLIIIILAAVVVQFGRGQQAAAPSPSATESRQTNASTTPTATSAQFDKTKYSLSDPVSPWIVVNKARPLSPIDYAPNDLVSVGNGQRMRAEAAKALEALINDAKKDGLTITALSGYRSYGYQVEVYGNEVKANGQTVADSQSARPGHSEHQTGWAVDVGGGGCGIEDCFGNTAEGKWVATNAYKYGFIIRYTNQKQSITGFRGEPWHIRYIGTELSAELHDKNVATLEEFFGLPAAPNYTD